MRIPLLKLTLSFLVLFFWTLFIYFNVKYMNNGGQAYPSLVLTFLTFFFLFLIDSGRLYFRRVKISTVFLFLFLIFIMLKIAYDSGDLSILKAHSIGTRGGVIFAFSTGLVFYYVMTLLYRVSQYSSHHRRSVSRIVNILLALNIILVLDIFIYYLGDIRSDIFLIIDNQGNYQRAADLMFMNFQVLASLVAISFLDLKKTATVINFQLIGILLISIVLVILMQLIASNKGAVTITAFTLILFIFYSILPYLKAHPQFSLNFSTIFFGAIGRKVFKKSVYMVSLLLILVAVLAVTSKFDIGKMRILSFGQGKVSSIDSRIDIIQNNFIEQFQYAPIFGNTEVELLTTGAGTYQHSLLLSIITHLGLIGLVMFFIVNLSMYIGLKKAFQYNDYLEISHNKIYSLFRLFSLSAIFILATFSSFYTWMPYWFSLGLFGVILVKRYD
jgi:hypothetical protein